MQFVLFQHFFSPLQTWIKFCNTSTVQIAVAHSYLRHAGYNCNCISVSTWYGSTLTKFETISLSLTHVHVHAHARTYAFNGIPKYSLIRPHKTNFRKFKIKINRYKRFSGVLRNRPGTLWKEAWGNEVQHKARNVNKTPWIHHRVNHLSHSLCICFVHAKSIEDIFTGLFYL